MRIDPDPDPDALLSAVQWSVSKLVSFAGGVLEAWAASENFSPNIEALRTELLLLQATLQAARYKQIHGHAMEELLGKLKHSVYNVEDLLDELDYFRIQDLLNNTYKAADEHAHDPAKAVRKLACLPSRCLPKLAKLLPCSSSPNLHNDNSGQSTPSGTPHTEHTEEAQMTMFNTVAVSEKLKIIVEQLLPVRREVAKILQSCVHRDLDTYEGDLIGIEHARNKLNHILCKGDNQLSRLSIVGFGGLGKTTLAKAMYHRAKMTFDCSAFVSISRNPNMKEVFMHILYDLHKQNYLDDIPKNEEQLIHEIKKFLRTKRYLIVIDDLWDTKSWDTISLSLPRNDCGSRIITTTRVNKVAEKCCSDNKDSIYKIMPLGYENSKQLFLKKCFGSEDTCRDALAEVDAILKICGGMPLAVISIASAILPFSAGKIKEQYQEMMKSLHSVSGELHCLQELTRILSYSYLDLPNTDLKACLMYLAASAKNQIIQRDNLVRKWIAEGLIPEANNCTREEVAGQYFDELISRNVIQPVKYVNCLGKETYEVTYMMLYVLRLLSRKENFATFLLESKPDAKVSPTRLFIRCSDSELPIGTDKVNLINFRSVTMLGPAYPVLFKHLKNVQLLDLDGCKDLDNSAMDDICLMIKLKYLSLKQTQVTTLPSRIGKLQNLETLDLRRTQISNLPREIQKLQNLETLDVRQTQVKELPKEILQLPKLTHLHFGQSGSSGVKLSAGSDQLKSVKVMGTVDARECSENAMKEISELIEVREIEVVLYDGYEDMERNDKLLSFIGKCSNLKSLTIYGDSNPSDKPFPESPNFPQLEKLNVAGRFVKVPGWISQLRTLTLLVIRVWKLEENDLLIIGGLPCLSVLALTLVALPGNQLTITSSADFTKLEVFCFDCRVPWVSFEEKSMPNLKHLQLKLYSGTGGKLPSGVTLLESLNIVILLYSSQYAGSDSVTKTIAVVREDAANHANMIELSVNGDQEIFPSNRSANRGVAGAEFDTSGSREITEDKIEEELGSE